MTARQPSLFIPHGGGPCFFMPDPAGTWTGMGEFLRTLPDRLATPPRAILVVSAHWETQGFQFTSGARPSLIYDYYGFPPETYALRYDAPGSPDLAEQAAGRLRRAGLSAGLDPTRGFDHGVFIPLKVAFPGASIPVVEMSVDQGLDPTLHLEAGRALSGLRDEGVLIVGSGLSFHNLRGFGDPRYAEASIAFDRWLTSALAEPGPVRAEALSRWALAPGAEICHPTAEHLIPLMVAAGAAEDGGVQIYSERVMQAAVSGYRFG